MAGQEQTVVVEIPGVGNVEFPASMSQTQIAQAAAKLHSERQNTPPDAAALKASQGPSLMDEPRSALDTVLDWLPTIGGTVGGITGGIGGTVGGFGVGGVPGAIGGATLGGAAGEAGKQLINRARGKQAPGTMTGAATAIGKEGAIQGGAELVGGVAAKGMAKAGRALVENAVRPTQTLLRDFPNVIDTIVRERLPVGAGIVGKKGSVQAAAKLGAASRSVRTLLDKAEASGTRFSASQVLNPVTDLIDDIAKQPLARADEQKLSAMINQFLKEHPGPLTPNAVKDLKQAAQNLSQTVMRAERQGAAVTADQAMGGRFNRAVAKGSREALETIPGVGSGEKLAQDLIGAKRALTQAEQRRLSLMAESISGLAGAVSGALGPGGGADERTRNAALAWLATRGIASPRSMSRGGLALTSQQAKELVRQIPRLAATVLLQQSKQGQNDEPE